MPLFALARELGEGPRAARGGLGWGALAGVVFFAPLVSWIGRFGDLPLVLLVAAEAAFVAAFLALLAAWGRRPGRAFVGPLLWIGFETLRAEVPLSGFPWGLLGLTQHDGGLFLPVARTLTVSGVGLALAGVAGGLEAALAAWRRRGAAGTGATWPRAVGSPLAGLAGVVLVSGLLGLVPVPDATGQTLDIAGVQGYTQELPPHVDREDVGRVASVVAGQLETTRALAAAGDLPDVTVWPENSLDADFRDVPALGAAVDEALDLLDGGPLLTGALLDDPEDPLRIRNVVVELRGDGEIADVHVKRALVPFGEYVPLRPLLGGLPQLEVIVRDQVPGDEATLFEIAGARLAAVLCFESVYPELVADQVRAGAQVLVVSTNNSSFGRSAASAQHLTASQLRAVETGRWVLQAGISGVSGVIDPTGAVTQRTELFTEAVVRGDLPLLEGLTPAVRYGDVVGTLSVLATAAVAVVVLAGAARRDPPDHPTGAPRAATPGERREPDVSPVGGRQRPGRVVGAVLVAALVPATVLPTTAAHADEQVITTPGALTRIGVGADLTCAVNHVDDAAGEFFQDTACATLVATGGTLYGPAEIPAGSGAGPRTAVTAVAQSAVDGTGSAADPYRMTTVVGLGDTGLRLTQFDTYVAGEESYRTDVVVTNTGATAATGILYRAGDCYLQDSDVGYGQLDEVSGAVACVAPDPQVPSRPGARIQQWLPLTPGSAAYEARYSDVWARIGAQEPFDDSCACDTRLDNGAGLSWTFDLAAGAEAGFSHLTTFSPSGREPLGTTKTVADATVDPGGVASYTITVDNPNDSPAVLDRVTDTLPDGFAYRPGTTTGATTDDPVVDGQTLTWAGPIGVPAGASVRVSFEATVAAAPGTYPNRASAVGRGVAVAPTGPTAAVTVGGGGGGGGPVRVAGATRIETAVEVSRASFPASAEAVVLARADTYPDALAGAPLARALGAPILLTAADGLVPAVAAEVERLGATRAVLLGGEVALGADVARDLEGLGVATERVYGLTRFGTAAAAARALAALPGEAPSAVYVAQGADPDARRGWPDALAASALAAAQGRPVLLVTTGELPSETAEVLEELDPGSATVVGGRAAVSDAVAAEVAGHVDAVDRIAGLSRYETAAFVADAAVAAGMSPAQTWVASGENFPDALVAGPAAAASAGVLLLAAPADLGASPPTADALAAYADRVETVRLLGGPVAISDRVGEQIAAVLEGG